MCRFFGFADPSAGAGFSGRFEKDGDAQGLSSVVDVEVESRCTPPEERTSHGGARLAVYAAAAVAAPGAAGDTVKPATPWCCEMAAAPQTSPRKR